MSRLFVVGAIAALAGCDTVFGLSRDDDAPHDARMSDALDAPEGLTNPCAGRTPVPQFCFDFDGPTFVGYERGTTFPVAPTGSGVSTERRIPGYTAPNGLWLEAAMSGTAVITRQDDTVTYTRIEATLRLRAIASATVGRSIVLLQLGIAGASPCHADLETDALTLVTTYRISCGTDTMSADIGMLDDTWQLLTLTFDRVTGRGTAKLGGNAKTELMIFGGVDSGSPSILFGLIGVAEPGMIVAYDDITVLGQ